MKRGLIIGLFFIIVFSGLVIAPSTSCSESDSGLEYTKKGIVTITGPAETLEERGLESSDGLVVTSPTTAIYKVHYVVKNVTLGEEVLFPTLTTAKTKINKINYYSDGNASNSIEIIVSFDYEDTCVDENTLTEYSCLNNNVNALNKTCDYGCANGKCSEEPDTTACVSAGYKCTSAVRGCGHYTKKDLSCPGGDEVICCKDLPSCGDGVCFSHEISGYGETSTSCPQDCAKTYEILIRGKLVNQLTGEPVKGAKLMSAYEFSPDEVITDSTGEFSFKIKTDFIIKEGGEIGKSDNGGQWSFYRNCYDYATLATQKDYEKWENGQLIKKYGIALREGVFDEAWIDTEVSGKSELDVGELMIYPRADITIKSDIATGYSVMYKYKNSEGYNGPGQSGYSKEHYLSSALPLDYDVFIQFHDESGKEYKSSTYHVPRNAHCGIVSLKYFDGESEWSVITEIEPDEDTGPIEIPEEIEDNEEISSNLCLGCLGDKICYPLGYRKSDNYCSEDLEFIEQKEADETCENSFECQSNLCIDDQCVKKGVFKRILDWFRNLFGDE